MVKNFADTLVHVILLTGNANCTAGGQPHHPAPDMLYGSELLAPHGAYSREWLSLDDLPAGPISFISDNSVLTD
jgi:hypothetical protein